MIYLKQIDATQSEAVLDYTHIKDHEYRLPLYCSTNNKPSHGIYGAWGFEIKLISEFLSGN